MTLDWRDIALLAAVAAAAGLVASCVTLTLTGTSRR